LLYRNIYSCSQQRLDRSEDRMKKALVTEISTRPDKDPQLIVTFAFQPV
jgi:hypothetical protein